MSGRRDGAPRGPSLHAAITSEPLVGATLLDGVGDPAHGGVVLFIGRVRTENQGHLVRRLHYEAYVEMAEAELTQIVRDVARRFEVGAITAIHRIGTLAPGEASLAVAVAAGHRDAAYRASRAVVEAIKQRLPIWKREEYADGTARWLGGSPSPGQSAEGSAAAVDPQAAGHTGSSEAS